MSGENVLDILMRLDTENDSIHSNSSNMCSDNVNSCNANVKDGTDKKKPWQEGDLDDECANLHDST
eukprot:9395027-Ditylum_brightwellii.AAC.1